MRYRAGAFVVSLVMAFSGLGGSQAMPSSGLQVAPECPGPQPALVTDFNVYQTPVLPEPAARQPFRDPVFGSCVVRVTDRDTDVAPGDDSPGMKNEYSRVQSFNADGTRILVRDLASSWYLYDALTLELVRRLPFDGAVDPRWDARDPNVLYYSDGTRLMRCDVTTSRTAIVHDFAADFPDQSLVAVWSRWEGSPSADGRYWGFMAEDEDWLASTLLVYDREADRVVASRDLRDWPDELREFDSVTISPLGTYLLVYFSAYCQYGELGSDEQPCGLMVYDRDLEHSRSLLRIVGHSDAALDAEGREVLVYQDNETDQISVLDLTSGEITPLWPIDFSHTPLGLHFSGRAFDLPGWALVSTYDGDPASYTWMDDQVFAVELKPEGRVVRLAHTHTLYDESMEQDYWAEPHASVNQDFTRVVFTTNWERSGTEQVEMYLIELPLGWVEQLS